MNPRPWFEGRRATWLTILGLLLLSLVVRLPFFFRAVLDWDESTFILIGQSLLDGHLPYVQLWDVKPPLLFAFFALAIALFGHDIAGVRLAGAVCVAATACLVYLTAARWYRRSAAVLGACLCILASSLLDDGQATMSEHVMLPALMGAVYLLLAEDESPARFGWVGAFLAVATLVRLNMAFGVVAVGLLLLVHGVRGRPDAVRRLAAYCGGGLVVVALTGLPYLLTGELTTLSHAGAAALGRSSSENSALGSLLELSVRAFTLHREETGFKPEAAWLNGFVWLTAALGLVMLWHRRRSLSGSERRGIGWLTLLGGATAVGIVLSGGAFGHYLIQLVPFAALFAVAAVHHAAKLPRVMLWSLAVMLTVPSLAPVVAEYRMMLTRASAREDLRYGPAYEIAAYLKAENPSARPVYLLTGHIAYWLIRAQPPTRLAHPSAIAKPYIAAALGRSPSEEIRNIFRNSPEFVVLSGRMEFLPDDLDAQLRGILVENYVLARRFTGRNASRGVVPEMVDDSSQAWRRRGPRRGDGPVRALPEG